MNSSPSIANIAKALSVVHSTIEGAKKDSVNPHFRSKYADLGAVWDAVREPLEKTGLSVIQPMGKDEHGYFVATVLMHGESGEWIESKTYIPLAKEDPQGAGSGYTYARRYGLSSMLGVCPVDDDANQAQQGFQKPTQQRDSYQRR